MARKGLNDRLSETENATQQELDESAKAMDRLFEGGPTDAADTDAADPSQQKAARDDLAGQEIYQRVRAYSDDLLNRVLDGQPIDLDRGMGLLSEMVRFMDRDEALFSVALHANNGPEFLSHHGVNVAVQTIKLAAALGLGMEERTEAAAVGLFHDLGKGTVPRDVLYKAGKLSDSQLRTVRDSVKKTREILAPFEDQYPWLCEASSQVYERVDGTGYPNGLKGGEIHRYAQIVGLADIYEALTHTRPQRGGFMHFSAIKQILGQYKPSFDKSLLKAFLDHFTLFPLETLVRLNSGAIGKVMATYSTHPLKPEIRIIMDAHGNHVWSEQMVDLAREPLLHIVDAVPAPEPEASQPGG